MIHTERSRSKVTRNVPGFIPPISTIYRLLFVIKSNVEATNKAKVLNGQRYFAFRQFGEISLDHLGLAASLAAMLVYLLQSRAMK